MNKRGSSAVEVSILIFLILGVLLGYMILAPEDIRDELLEDIDSDGEGGSVTDSLSGEAILSVSPGEVQPTKSEKMLYGMDPTKIYSRVDSETQTLANSLSVARSLIHNNYKNVYFDIDTADLDSLEVLFLIVESKGKLKIEINGNEIYYGELTSNELPLEIPVGYLQDKDNILTLTSNSPGWKLFSSNYYILQDVELLKDYLLQDTQKTRLFTVDDVGELKTATLSYYITCNTNVEGRMTIYLNEREVFDDDIFCEYLEERELVLDTDYIRTTNTLLFEIDEGDYNIDELEVELLMDARDYPSYSFEIDSDDYEAISSGEKEVYLELSFGDDSSHKEATIYVQENSFGMDTYDTDYEREISSYVDNGANTIKIQPSVTFDIENLKVSIK
jgi:hypothetical protein